MDSGLVISIINKALNATIQISAPFLLLSGIIGFFISLLQSIFQIQDPTITFIPKVIAILAFLYYYGYNIAEQLKALAELCLEVLSV